MPTYAIVAFDAMTGKSGQLSLAQQRLLGPAHEGIFTQEAPPSQSGPVTLRYIDRSGGVRWSHTLTGSNKQLQVTSVVPTPDDGSIFIASADGSVDLGDDKIEIAAGSLSSFVFALDATGATRWWFTVPDTGLGHIALRPDGQFVLSGSTHTSNASNRFLALAAPAGIVRVQPFDGTAVVNDLAVGVDGRAWVEINVVSDEDGPPPVLRIAGHTFTDAATYLFGIVL